MITPSQITYTKLPVTKPVKIVPPKVIPRTFSDGKGQIRTVASPTK